MRRLQQGPALGKATRELLAERLASLPPVVHSVASADGTRKLLVRLHDGLEVECVLIPMTGGVQHRVREQGHGRQADEELGEEEEAEEGKGKGKGPEERGERRGRKKGQKELRTRGNRAARGHTTLCVSSQVGCARGCAFCATGAMGLVRCLSAEEILAQCFHGRRVAGECGLPPLNNVVFMGMGEPLNNPVAVGAAVERLTHDNLGFGFSKTRVTVSTVAPSPEAILRHAAYWYSRSGGGGDDGDDGRTTGLGANERASSDQKQQQEEEEEGKGCLADAMLAWSVHAADDATRKLLVPTTRHSMVELREAFRAALASRPSKTLRTLMIEVRKDTEQWNRKKNTQTKKATNDDGRAA
jgi:adenine C2-methylase RlmN of 23S rRNA A2503 and tRNA A37